MASNRTASRPLRLFWDGLAPNSRGALWILAAAVGFSFMALLAKLLGQRLDSFQVAFFRALFGFLAVIPFAWRGGPALFATRRLPMHLVRGVVGATAMLCGFYAITHLPLADAVAISYARPLFLIVLAVLFLGEGVRVRRWTATVVGFLGVLVMLRPTGAVELASLVALFAAFLIAIVNVLVKKLATTERPATIVFYFGAVATAASLLPALAVWRTPTGTEFVLLVVMGTLGALSQMCMVQGFALGEATAVTPIDYTRLLFAGVLGYLFFGEVPDRWTLIGAVIIVTATLYIALREARLGKAPASPPAEQSALGPGPPAG